MNTIQAIGRAQYWGRIIIGMVAAFFGGAILGAPLVTVLQLVLTGVTIYWAYQRCLAIGWHGGWAIFGPFFLGILVFGIAEGKDEYPEKNKFDAPSEYEL